MVSSLLEMVMLDMLSFLESSIFASSLQTFILDAKVLPSRKASPSQEGLTEGIWKPWYCESVCDLEMEKEAEIDKMMKKRRKLIEG